jgi:endonuclease III
MPADNPKKHAAKIARLLAKHYPDARCSLDFPSPLELLVATILSAQCTDVRVNLVTKTLFKKYPTAAHYAKASQSELERDIQSTGFFRNKAKNIRACCQTLLEKHDGQVPKDMESLVQLAGVGRKTANVVLGTAYGIAVGVVVDTHVARIARRLGLSAEKDPEKIERDLMAQFDRKEWIALSHRLIRHGRKLCMARSPNCGECPLNEICPKIGVE